MKVHIYEDEWWPVTCYEKHSKKSWRRDPIDVPDKLIKEYDKAYKAFNDACKKIDEIAIPIYQARREEAAAKIKSKPLKLPVYLAPPDLVNRIEKALF